jgi:hypothetical protein
MSTTLRNFTSGLALGVIALLVACSGGGGGGNPMPPTGGPTATPVVTPTATPTPVVANASGKVVDEAANTPLSGITVAIAAQSAGAAYNTVATTAADGTFAFSTAPGAYVLRIGDGSTTGPKATLYQAITLNAGTDALHGITPGTAAGITYTAAQTSGNFRLEALTANAANCLSGANSGRTGSLPQMVPDEYLTEVADAWLQAEIAQSTDTPTSAGLNSILDAAFQSEAGKVVGSTSMDAGSCTAWTGPAYSYVNGNPPYPFATNALNVRYGAAFGVGNTTYGDQIWTIDPR